MSSDEEEVYIRPKLNFKNMTDEEIKEHKRVNKIKVNKKYYINKRRRLDAVKEAYADILYILKHNPDEDDLAIWSVLYSAEDTLGVCSGLNLKGYSYDREACKMVKKIEPFKYAFGGVDNSTLTRQNEVNFKAFY
tara:strand:+ start:1988 stop:2392 length:405 start_codon:yes stop_codon:yes gene_type:complete